jgi:hypothetical protein
LWPWTERKNTSWTNAGAELYLRRKIRGKDGEYQYYAYVLEAVLLFLGGMVLPLVSVFLENSAELETIENDIGIRTAN